MHDYDGSYRGLQRRLGWGRAECRFLANGSDWIGRVVAGMQFIPIVDLFLLFSEPPIDTNLISYTDHCTCAFDGAVLD